MPELDGFGFVEAIKSNPATSTIPVAFLTASTDEKDRQLGLKLGARYFINKPFNMNELAWKLKRLLTERTG
jgi:putative two-component system response regulator